MAGGNRAMASGISADTSRMSLETARRLSHVDPRVVRTEEMENLVKRPPDIGAAEDNLHQQSRFTGYSFLKKMMPMYPMFCLVALTIGISLVTLCREVNEHPAVQFKTKHAAFDPDTYFKMVRDFARTSPFRKIAIGEDAPEFVKKLNEKFFHLPPKLPGEDNAELVPAEERRVDKGKPMPAGYKPANND